MHAFPLEVIPAIDLINAQVVRLTEGDFDTSEVFAEDPIEQAKKFEELGFQRLHIVDLDGAKQGHPQNLSVLKGIAEQTTLELDYGGGIRDEEDLKQCFDNGAAQVSIGSVAAKEPEKVKKWIAKWGGEQFIIAADSRKGMISTDGWKTDSTLEINSFIETYAELGIQDFLCTDIAKDGRLAGPNVDLYEHLVNAFPELRIIASGGVSGLEDLDKLAAIGIQEVIVGKALYKNLLV